jgi:hypothetical protein
VIRDARNSERGTLGDEGGVDEEVVVGVDGTVVIEVAGIPGGVLGDEAGVDLEVVVGVHYTVEIGVAVLCQLGEDAAIVNALPGERVQQRLG